MMKRKIYAVFAAIMLILGITPAYASQGQNIVSTASSIAQDTADEVLEALDDSNATEEDETETEEDEEQKAESNEKETETRSSGIRNDVRQVKAQRTANKELTATQVRKAVGVLKALDKDKVRKLNSTFSEEQIEALEDIDKEQLKALGLLSRARLDELKSRSPEELKDIVENIRLRKVENEGKAREIKETVKEKLEKRLKTLDEEYKKARKFQNETKEEFIQAKERLKECEDSDSEECNEAKEKAIENAKDYLSRSAEIVVSHLNKIKTRIEASEEMSEEESAEIISDIETAMSGIEDILDKIESAQTKEEVKKAAKEIMEEWKNIRSSSEKYAARAVHSAVGEVLRRSLHLEEKLECTLQSMEEQGIDASDLEADIEEFSTLVESARTSYEEGKKLFEEAKEDDEETVSKAREIIKESQKQLEQAHQMLVEIHNTIKEKGGKVTECRVDEDLDAGEIYEVKVPELEEEPEEEE